MFKISKKGCILKSKPNCLSYCKKYDVPYDGLAMLVKGTLMGSLLTVQFSRLEKC